MKKSLKMKGLKNTGIWVLKIKDKYQAGTDVNLFILEEAGKVFSEVLKDAGVFKMDEVGQRAFKEFLMLL